MDFHVRSIERIRQAADFHNKVVAGAEIRQGKDFSNLKVDENVIDDEAPDTAQMPHQTILQNRDMAAMVVELQAAQFFPGAWARLERAGVEAKKLDSISVVFEKGLRPNPSTYLSAEQIGQHLQKFEGGVTKFYAKAPTGEVGPPEGTFVMPRAVADKMIADAGGDVRKLEQSLSLPKGSLGENPVRVDIANPRGLRMSSGNEPGANSQWRAGGYTGGGTPEAVIDQVPVGEYTTSPVR